MRHKKAQGLAMNKTVKIILVIIVLTLILLIFVPKIWTSLGQFLNIIGINTCTDTGTSAAKYNNELETYIDRDNKEKALSTYVEFRSCFTNSLTLPRGYANQLAELLCKKGHFNYSVEVYDYASLETISRISEICRSLDSIERYYMTKNYAQANERLETSLEDIIEQGETTLPSWNLLMADVYFSVRNYQESYQYYHDKTYYLELTQKQKTKIKDSIRNIYIELITEELYSIRDTGNFCINQHVTEPFTTQITISELFSYLGQRGNDMNIESKDLIFGSDQSGCYGFTSLNKQITINEQCSNDCKDILTLA